MTPYDNISTTEPKTARIEASDGTLTTNQVFGVSVEYALAPPQGYEVIDAFAAKLREDAALESGLGGAGRIYAHRSPASKPDRYVVVREPVIPGTREHFTRLRTLPIQVMAECRESHPNPDWWLSAIHTRIYEIMSGEDLPLLRSEMLLPVKRETVPSGTAYDADDHAYYSSAEYRTTLGPT